MRDKAELIKKKKLLKENVHHLEERFKTMTHKLLSGPTNGGIGKGNDKKTKK